MKKLLVSMLGLLSLVQVSAQVVKENESAFVYYLPQTQLNVDIEYTEEVRKAGPFHLFAEQYLGATDIVEESENIYEIQAVRVKETSVPDYNKMYKVSADLNLLSLTSNGILKGYNITTESKQAAAKTTKKKQSKQETTATVMPMLEEQMNAPTLEKMAEGAAKQIFRIRETRMYILSGEVEHAPADGKAMQLVLAELDKQEKTLTELFTGTTETQKKHYHVIYTPKETEDYTLALFSEQSGIAEVNNENATPVILTLSAHKQAYQPVEEKKKAKAEEGTIYYNLPGYADIAISYKGKVLAEDTYPIAQFGVVVPLSKAMLTAKPAPSIHFNTKTGNIQSIEK